MDDRIKGKAHEVSGAVRRRVGMAKGDEKDQVAGDARRIGGKIQQAWGRLKSRTRKAF